MTEIKLTPIEAFIKAKSEMLTPTFNKVNPHFKNAYADLAEIKRSTARALADNKLSYSEWFGYVGDKWGVGAKIIYKDGTVVAEGFYPIDENMKDQQKGSAITYGRRYLRASLCDVVADSDDDGNAAQQHVQKAKSSGPLGLTELKKKIRELSGELKECEDIIQIDGMVVDYKDALAQCKRDLIEWYDGAMEAIERRKTEIRNDE